MDDTRWLDAEQDVAWRRLVTLLYQLPARLEEPLQPAGTSFFEYMILAMLSDGPDRSLTMGHLAELTSSSPSRLSHAASRLESRGWIARRPDPHDRRVTVARLTDQGFETLRGLAPAHVESVRQLVFDALDEDQVRALGEILGGVLCRVAPDVVAPGDSTATTRG